MTDFIMLAALLVVTAIAFVAPAIYLVTVMVRSGWRLSLLGLLTLALTYITLRYLLLTPMLLGGISQMEHLGEKLLRVTLLSVAAGAVCGAVKLPAVLLNRKKPIPYADAAAIARITTSGLALAFGGIYILWIFLLRLGSIFDIGKSAQRLSELPERAKLFWAMTRGGDELTVLPFSSETGEGVETLRGILEELSEPEDDEDPA